MRMLLEILRGADSVRIGSLLVSRRIWCWRALSYVVDEARADMEMPCTRLLGQPDHPPFPRLYDVVHAEGLLLGAQLAYGVGS